jgi:hypothetical protein
MVPLIESTTWVRRLPASQVRVVVDASAQVITVGRLSGSKVVWVTCPLRSRTYWGLPFGS